MSNAKVVNSAAASLHQDLRTFLRTEFECGLFDAYSQEVFRYMLYRVWTMNIAGGSSNILPFEACEEQEHELEDALVNGVFVQYIIENPRCMMFGFPDVKRLGSMHRQYGYTLMDDEAKIYKVVVKQVVRVCHSRDLIMGGGLSGGLPLKFTCKAGECHGKGLKSGHDKSQCHGREEIMEPEVEKATTDVDEMEDYR